LDIFGVAVTTPVHPSGRIFFVLPGGLAPPSQRIPKKATRTSAIKLAGLAGEGETEGAEPGEGVEVGAGDGRACGEGTAVGEDREHARPAKTVSATPPTLNLRLPVNDICASGRTV
jgi:hypothetical protein